MNQLLPYSRLRAAGVALAAALMISASAARADDGTPRGAASQPAAGSQSATTLQTLQGQTPVKGPILVFQLASTATDVIPAQQVTQLVVERLRMMYGDTVELVPDIGSEPIPAIVRRMHGALYVGGSIEKSNSTYFVDLQSRDGATNAMLGEERFSTATFDVLPKSVALVSLIESGPLIANAHYVLVPLSEDDVTPAMQDKDAYLKVTQDDLIRELSAKGITTTIVSRMDPVDVRIGAPDLCKDNDATAVLVGHTWHKQDYKQGAFKGGMKGFEKVLEVVPIAGPIMAGVVNATGNAVASVGGSDDKYPAHAELALTQLNCEGKRTWSGTSTGDTAHFSDHNISAGEVGAIDIAVKTIVDNLVAHR